MSESNLFDDIQESLDAMQLAVQQCAAEEIAVGEMWSELDANCQKLAQLSAGDLPDEDEDEDKDGPEELDFEDDEDEGSRDDDADEDEVLH